MQKGPWLVSGFKLQEHLQSVEHYDKLQAACRTLELGATQNEPEETPTESDRYGQVQICKVFFSCVVLWYACT